MPKTVNYSDANVELMTGMYMGVRDQDEAARKAVVLEIADLLQKGERSIRAKLCRLTVPGTDTQLYVANVAKSKVLDGEPAKKVELAARLINVTGVDSNKVDADRVAKMNKTDIAAFIAAFEALTPEVEATDAEAAEAEDASED